jgi:5-(carboxyamino)imidazole ribonucleotide synthase
MDFETVYNFGKSGCINFWNWTVNLDALLKLEAEGLKVYPSPKTLQLIQNKGTQKILHKHAIPTASYKRFEDLKSLVVEMLDSKLECLLFGNVLNLDTTETVWK